MNRYLLERPHDAEGVIAADRIRYAVMPDEGTPVSEEEDAFHQAMLLGNAWHWISDQIKPVE